MSFVDKRHSYKYRSEVLMVKSLELTASRATTALSMISHARILWIAIFGLICAAAIEAQQTYDGRDGPHVFGPPGKQVYIRGQNEGPYQVPGVGGTFQNSPSQGEHVYRDELGNTYVNRKGGNGQPGGRYINGPDLIATNEKSGGRRNGGRNLYVGGDGSVLATGADGRTVGLPPTRYQRDVFHVERPGRRVIVNTNRRRRSPQYDIYAVREDGRSVTVQSGRYRRSPQRVQGENFVARGDQAGVWNDRGFSSWKRPDGRTVSVGPDGSVIVSGSPNGKSGPQRYN